jgi:1-deoxy-D-xylulose-5-phosphate synthase
MMEDREGMNSYLDKINDPKDLKKIPIKEIPKLAEEIREKILTTVSKNGGHLASNLGAVELTLALHYVFDAPEDRIIWDVGHQSYTHKLLTGRRNRFYSLRQYQGLSGFPKREESVYDAFDTGHSGTSISAAIGMLEARELKGENSKVIAIIGDGSMTSGMAFEGVNHAGGSKRGLIVVLNDNEMSISPNVGALASYLSRVLTRQPYRQVRQGLKDLLSQVPLIGKKLVKGIKRVEGALKILFIPGILFEEFGFKYIGPISGHRLDYLIETFENIKAMEGPILVHVVTQKGKGYLPAERDPVYYHGVGPFDLKTGRPKKDNTVPTYTEIFQQSMIKLGYSDDKCIAITAAMSNGTGLEEFGKIFPDRFFDVGIAEQHGVTFAAGMAAEGLKPVVAIYSTFLQRAYDQILHDVCLPNLPVTFAVDRAGLVGEDGPTHHGAFDLTYLRSLPNMVVMSPKDEDELQHMLKTAIDHPGPAAVRYPRGRGVGIWLSKDLKNLEIGQAELLKDGRDAAIIALGHMVHPSLKAAEQLELEGIDVAVVNGRFVKPLDKELILELALKIGTLITIEENTLHGGFGSAVLELLEDQGLFQVRVKRIGLPDIFIEHGSQSELRSKYGLSIEGIVDTVKGVLKHEYVSIKIP